jgi:hypothetical protein
VRGLVHFGDLHFFLQVCLEQDHVSSKVGDQNRRSDGGFPVCDSIHSSFHRARPLPITVSSIGIVGGEWVGSGGEGILFWWGGWEGDWVSTYSVLLRDCCDFATPLSPGQLVAVRHWIPKLRVGCHLCLTSLRQLTRRDKGHAAGNLLPHRATGQRALKTQLHFQS